MYSDGEVPTYQLRVYIYQAKELHSRDKSGLSDPYRILLSLSTVIVEILAKIAGMLCSK